MIIYDKSGTILYDAIVTKEAEHEEELMKSDFVKLSWNDAEYWQIPVDAYIVPFNDGIKYSLLEPYVPEQKSEAEWTYEPEFQHPKMYLSKVPFIRKSYDTQTEPNEIDLMEWSYTGFIGTLLQYFCDSINAVYNLQEPDEIGYNIIGEIDNIVSTTFSAVDILSALSNVANLLQCEWHIDWHEKTLFFGHIKIDRQELDTPILEVDSNIGIPSVRNSKEGYWNAYQPQGSTRNMTVRAASGENVQANVRLALNKTQYPDGIIYTDGEGNVLTKAQFEALGLTKYIKSVIYESVYPKLDLFVYDVRFRERYLLDENGEKVIDHYDGSTPVYKRYAVWFMRLAYPTYNQQGEVTDWTDYTIDPETQVINGKTLMGAFQANTREGAETSPLAGQGDGDGEHYGFSLSYHEEGEVIPPGTDGEGDTGVTIKAGDYEIILQQKDDLIIPTTQAIGMIPKGEATPSLLGNVVNLYNVVMSEDYLLSAQDDLKNETLKTIAHDTEDNNSYTFKSKETAFEQSKPNLYIGRRVIYKNDDYELETRVMKIVTKLDYDFEQEITVGNEVLKGNQTQMQEKVDNLVSTFAQGGNGMSQSQVLRLIENWVTPRFLSRINPDVAQRLITFVQQAAMQAGITIGSNYRIDGDGEARLKRIVLESLQSSNYVSGLTGWNIDKNGNMEAETLHLRSALEVDELRINRQQAQEGDTIFAENDQIESVEESYDEAQGMMTYILTLKDKWEGYFTAQQYGNILRGKINTLAAKDAGVSDYTGQEYQASQQEDEGGNKYYTSFMQVIATHNTDPNLGVNKIRVVLFGDSEVPMTKNYPPCALMAVARWGCIDYSAEYEGTAKYADVVRSIKRRQQSFMITSSEGRIVKLTGVDSPILRNGNYGTTLGILPEFVQNYPTVHDRMIAGRDYLYAQGVVVGDFIKIDVEGNPVPTVVDCGEWIDGSRTEPLTIKVWDAQQQRYVDHVLTFPIPSSEYNNPSSLYIGHGIYFYNKFNALTQQYETHKVRHDGGTWQCLQSQPVIESGVAHYYPPKWNSAYWMLVDGNDNLTIEFVSTNGNAFYQGYVNTVITPHLFYGNVDISSEVDIQYWSWTRETESGKTDADRNWDSRHTGTKVLTLVNEDMPTAWGRGNKAIFTCTVVINDGKSNVIVQNQVIA